MAVYVTYYGIPVHVSNEDLCSRTRCPVEVGPFMFVNTESLPYITPAVSSLADASSSPASRGNMNGHLVQPAGHMRLGFSIMP